MRARLLLVILAIAMYSAGVLAVDGIVLPAAGVNGPALVTAHSFDFLGPLAHQGATEPLAAIPRHSFGASRFFGLWLRPFGVHRRGMNDFWWALGSFAVLGTIGTMLLFLFPKRVRYLSQLLRAEPGPNHLLNILLGLMAYGLGYVLLRLSWLTIVGVPFIPFLIGGLWVATMLGIVAVSFTLGRLLFRRFDVSVPVLAEALAGLWLLFVTSMLPVLGWLAGGAAAALGLGLLLQTRFGSRQRWSLELLDDPAPQPAELDPKIVQLRRVR